MKIAEFEMERVQSEWEHVVECNLSDSGVHALTLGELLGFSEEKIGIDSIQLAYTQSNGTVALRELIAALYKGASVDEVEVTNGGSEANFITSLCLVEPGDEVVIMSPNYPQLAGLCRGWGATVKPFPLLEDANWAPDLDALRAAVSPKTKLIAICNPNNPTGAILSDDEMNGVVREAERAGAWILSDEIYQGAERNGVVTPTFFGRYDRVIVTNGLSKSYGLPGLRLGWIVAPPSLIHQTWSYHDYTTICPTALSDRLARIALQPQCRARILERTRAILCRNYPLLESWLRQHPEFKWVSPNAGAICFIRSSLPIRSLDFMWKLVHEKSLLIVPGIQFGIENHFRINYGADAGRLLRGLTLIDELLTNLNEFAPIAEKG